MDRPNHLFKYFSEDRIDVLEKGLIRYTQPTDFNDPFETYPNFIAIGDHEAIDKYANEFDMEPGYYENILSEELRKNSQFNNLSPQQKVIAELFCQKVLERQLPDLKSSIRSIFSSSLKLQGGYKRFVLKAMMNALSDTIGILCLTEKNDNLLMWSHYANSHKGFVLEFYPDHCFFDQRKKNLQLAEHLKKVRYTYERPEFKLFDTTLSTNENMDNWVNDFIWVKSQHWSYEEEWRIITTFRGCKNVITLNNSNIFLFPLPFDTIKNVYLGCKMSKEKIDNFVDLINGSGRLRHVQVYRALPDEKEYKLRFVKV